MPFGTVVVNPGPISLEARAPGEYHDAAVTSIGQPMHKVVVRPPDGKAKPLANGQTPIRWNASIILQKDVVKNGATVRVQQTITFSVITTEDFTAAETDTEMARLNDFLNENRITRVSFGEQ